MILLKKQALQKIDFIKVDVEGHEISMLQGGKSLILAGKPIILVELDLPRLIEANRSLEELLNLLGEWGYALFQANRNKLIPLRLEGLAFPTNAFCFHREAHASILESL